MVGPSTTLRHPQEARTWHKLAEVVPTRNPAMQKVLGRGRGPRLKGGNRARKGSGAAPLPRSGAARAFAFRKYAWMHITLRNHHQLAQSFAEIKIVMGGGDAGHQAMQCPRKGRISGGEPPATAVHLLGHLSAGAALATIS